MRSKLSVPALVTAVGLFTWATAGNAANVASDNAANSAYSDGWQGGDNGGTGFGAWSFTGDGNPSFGGKFTASSDNNGFGGGGAANGIDTSGTAWGIYANNGTTVTADRSLTGGALSIGQTFSVDFDNGFNDTGFAGVALKNAAGNDLFGFKNVGGGNPPFQYDDGSGIGLGLPAIQYNNNGFRLQFTLTGAGTYSAVIYTNSTTGFLSVATLSGNLEAGGGDQNFVKFTLYNSNAGNGGQHDQFFNSLSVIPEPSTIVLVGLGLVSTLLIRRRK